MWRIHTWPAEAITALIVVTIPVLLAHAAMPDDTNTDRTAARNNVERYYWSHRLVGSHVLNMRGQHIGRVDALVVNKRGTLTKVLVALNEQFDADDTPVPVEPNRAEIVSTKDARVTIIRIDLTRAE